MLLRRLTVGFFVLACAAAAAACSSTTTTPSSGGHPQESLITWAPIAGLPSLNGSPLCGQGASMNCMHVRYSGGLPRLRARFTHANHSASGATPMPLRPRIEPSVCVPCPPMSDGLIALFHGLSH